MSSTNQRGKNVVSASSGNTTRSQPRVGALAQQREQPLDDLDARVLALDRAQLGGADHDASRRTSCRDVRTSASLPATGMARPRARRYGSVDGARGRRPRPHLRPGAGARRRCRSRVRPGTVTGFLGPNGAGKTTTMRAIFGLTALDAGEVRWDGAPIDAAARRRFGYLPEERGLYPNMRIGDQLVYLGRLRGLTKATPSERAHSLARAPRPRRPGAAATSRTSRSATNSACS